MLNYQRKGGNGYDWINYWLCLPNFPFIWWPFRGAATDLGLSEGVVSGISSGVSAVYGGAG